MMHGPAGSRPQLVDSSYAWLRLGVALLLCTLGSVGMWTYVVSLPAVQSEFGVVRADATLPFTMAMVGFGTGNALLGRLTDRIGIFTPILFGIALIGAGYVGSGPGAEPVDVVGMSHSDRARSGDVFRSDDLRHFALVPEAARNCSRDRGHRQLCRRRDLAGAHRAFHRKLGLARDPYRHRHFLCRRHAAAVVDVPRRHAGVRSAGAGCHDFPCARSRHFAEHAVRAAMHRRSRMLCRDGDAAGAYRRLLRRSRLRRGARCRNAVADAGLRHRQPGRLGLHRRPLRRRGLAVDRRIDAGGRARAVSFCSMACLRSI